MYFFLQARGVSSLSDADASYVFCPQITQSCHVSCYAFTARVLLVGCHLASWLSLVPSFSRSLVSELILKKGGRRRGGGRDSNQAKSKVTGLEW